MKNNSDQTVFLPVEAREHYLLNLPLQSINEKRIFVITTNQNETERIFGRLGTLSKVLGYENRVSDFGHILSGYFNDLYDPNKKIIIIDFETISKTLPSFEEVFSSSFILSVGDNFTPEDFSTRLNFLKYLETDICYGAGEYARRGSIVDFIIAGEKQGIRVEFGFDKIESIRAFDPISQRSKQGEKMNQIRIQSRITTHFSSSFASIAQGSKILIDAGLAPRVGSIFSHLPKFTFLSFSNESDYEYKKLPQFSGNLIDLKKYLNSLPKSTTVTLISKQSESLTQKLNYNFNSSYTPHIADYPIEGFSYKDQLFLTDYEIFSYQAPISYSESAYLSHYGHFLKTINHGDIVVHADHGLSRFRETKTMEVGGIRREYIVLEFRDGDLLHLPTSKMYLLSKYVGKETQDIALTKLGEGKWKKKIQKAKKDSKRVAEKLLIAYREREQAQGNQFPPDDLMESEVENQFQYILTDDQKKALKEVYQDMEAPKQMNRLICGDVGFGKTEVALRAAVRAVSHGFQVIFLSPTTILSEQHYKTFSDRLSDLGIMVSYYNRFLTAKQKRERKRDIQKGSIDIILGTHALLSKDMQYSNPGLLIIDEEQRFGVLQKEKIASKFPHIDIISLSATPIPRSLHLSLTGVRDLSLITTPPKGRQPVHAQVAPMSETLIKNAIEKEIKRQGQVFLIYNKVSHIRSFASHIASLVPKVTFGVLHGQLKSQEIETTMRQFIEGHLDVLVASTIVENGVDIPNANTLIVIGAESFGLGTLYQLKGRVGRSYTEAYSYFLTTKIKLLPRQQKRLDALKTLSSTGGGFHLAMRDLEIRGAGNILGNEQSGHIESIGYELFTKLLTESLDDIKTVGSNLRIIHPDEVIIEIPINAYIPSEYTHSESEKMDLYHRANIADSLSQISELRDEMIDRFGQLPIEAEDLLKFIILRILAAQIGFLRITMNHTSLEIVPHKRFIDVLSTFSARWRVKKDRATIHKNSYSGRPLDFLLQEFRGIIER